MSTPWWFDEANVAAEQSLWDEVTLGEVLLPGLARVKVTKGAGRKIDDRSSAGSNGWHIKEKGPTPVEATVTLKLWEESHWQQWERHSQALTRRVRESVRRTAMPIAHPVLAALNVTAVYVVEVGGLEQETVGIWTADIKVLEFRPPTGSASRSVVPWAPPARRTFAAGLASDQAPGWANTSPDALALQQPGGVLLNRDMSPTRR